MLIQLDDHPVLAAKLRRKFNLPQQLGHQFVLQGWQRWLSNTQMRSGVMQRRQWNVKTPPFLPTRWCKLEQWHNCPRAHATPSQGMEIVMASPGSAWLQQLMDFLNLAIANKNNPNDIQSSKLSITHTSKLMASHFLLENLSLNNVTRPLGHCPYTHATN